MLQYSHDPKTSNLSVGRGSQLPTMDIQVGKAGHGVGKNQFTGGFFNPCSGLPSYWLGNKRKKLPGNR